MSYISSYDLEVEHKGTDKTNEVIKYLLENLKEYQEMVFTLYILEDGCTYDRWYQHNFEMIKLSKAFPKYVFTLNIDGEEPDDNKKNYYLNGKMDYNEGLLPTELRIEYERLEKNDDDRYEKIIKLKKIISEKERVYKNEEEVFYSSFDEKTGKIVYTKYERTKQKEIERSGQLKEIKETRKKLEKIRNEDESSSDFYHNNYEKLIFRDFDKNNLETLDFFFVKKDLEEDKKLSLSSQKDKIGKESIEKAKLIINKILDNEDI